MDNRLPSWNEKSCENDLVRIFPYGPPQYRAANQQQRLRHDRRSSSTSIGAREILARSRPGSRAGESRDHRCLFDGLGAFTALLYFPSSRCALGCYEEICGARMTVSFCESATRVVIFRPAFPTGFGQAKIENAPMPRGSHDEPHLHRAHEGCWAWGRSRGGWTGPCLIPGVAYDVAARRLRCHDLCRSTFPSATATTIPYLVRMFELRQSARIFLNRFDHDTPRDPRRRARSTPGERKSTGIEELMNHFRS